MEKSLDDILEEFTETVDIKDLKKESKSTPEKNKRSNKMVYKLTNKTFQPLQIILSENEMMLLGPRRGDNVIYVKQLTNQINNLQKKGMIKIRKMS